MKVVRIRVENYRNLKHVDVKLENLVALVGANNSGKSNFLRAMALPFTVDYDGMSKRLSWNDINKDAKDAYYSFIQSYKEDILNDSVDIDRFEAAVPTVSVTIDLHSEEIESYDVKDLLVLDDELDDGAFVPRIQYRWYVKNPCELLKLVKSLVADIDNIRDIKMSLLPMSAYGWEITSPDSSGNRKVSYEVLARFRHFYLPAERDGFAARSDRIGSKSLVQLLQNKVSPSGQMQIEKGYDTFLNIIREAADLDEVINWQEYSDNPRALHFFDSISVLPNMPPMSSIFSSIRLGYDDESLSFQGLGNRNLILMAVLLNAYMCALDDVSLRVVAVEEPEAHLCLNNTLLMASLFKAFAENDFHTQLVYSTHDTEFVNKVGLDKVIVLHDGKVLSLAEQLDPKDMDYLANNPNTDIFKLFFSHRLILVEGITEELLIKSYLQSNHELNDIKVLSFHKGYRDIIRIWKAINSGNGNKLAVIRDYDNQPNAQSNHEKMADEQVCVKTTIGYTLETDIVATGENHKLLVDHYGADYGWDNMNEDELQKDWRDNRKTDVMLRLCHDLVSGELDDFIMPKHIREALDFLLKPIGEKSNETETVA